MQYCYQVSYFQDENQNQQFDADEEHMIQLDLGESVCSTTDLLLEGCTYTSACNYDENANYYDGSCWWPSYGCGCTDEQGSISDNCGTCDIDATNDISTFIINNVNKMLNKNLSIAGRIISLRKMG